MQFPSLENPARFVSRHVPVLCSAPWQTLVALWGSRELVWEMSLRDIKGLNKGAFLGSAWIVLSPFIQTAAYVFIVSFVFQNRLAESSGRFDYAMYVLSGMIPWQILTYGIAAAPTLVRERMDLVKQVIYPIETLPLTNLIVGSFGAVVSLVIYFVLQIKLRYPVLDVVTAANPTRVVSAVRPRAFVVLHDRWSIG